MTATLVAELIILSLGGYMDNALIKEFCMFTKVALCVDYLLEMTFVIAVLSIDIKRVEVILRMRNNKPVFYLFTYVKQKSWLTWMTVKCQNDYTNLQTMNQKQRINNLIFVLCKIRPIRTIRNHAQIVKTSRRIASLMH